VGVGGGVIAVAIIIPLIIIIGAAAFVFYRKRSVYALNNPPGGFLLFWAHAYLGGTHPTRPRPLPAGWVLPLADWVLPLAGVWVFTCRDHALVCWGHTLTNRPLRPQTRLRRSSKYDVSVTMSSIET